MFPRRTRSARVRRRLPVAGARLNMPFPSMLAASPPYSKQSR